MDEILKSFRNFLFRDFFYIVCGGLIFRASREIGEIELRPLSGDTLFDGILLAGLAYAVGYLNQEVWSQTRFVTTARGQRYGRILRFLYRRHTFQDWADVPTVSHEHIRDALSEDEYNRILNHKLVGASMGSALLTTSILLVVAYFVHWAGLLLGLALLSVILGCAFVLLAWVKTMQQCKYLSNSDPAALWISGQLELSVNAWIESQPEPKPSRSDAMRRLIEEGLKG